MKKTMKVPDYSLAKSILGADFVAPQEVMKARSSIIYTDEQITALAESLPSEDVLRWCKKNGYAVIPAPPKAVSLLKIREIQSDHFYSTSGGWYADRKFARKDKTSFGWLAIKKRPIAKSTQKNWDNQNKLLSTIERVPNVAEMSWFITTYFEVCGVRLFKNRYVRTSSLDFGDYHVRIGGFISDGLQISYWDRDEPDSIIGISAARKKL